MEVEWDAVQTGMLALISEHAIGKVVPSETSQNDFFALPEYTPSGRGFVRLLHYLTRTPTYFYCWDMTGTITRQDKEPKPDCPKPGP